MKTANIQNKIDNIVTNINEYIVLFLSRIIEDRKLNTKNINIDAITKDICSRLPNKISEIELLDFLMDYIVSKSSFHPDYGKLASSIATYKLHYLTSDNMIDVVSVLYNYIDINGDNSPIISKEYYNNVHKYIDRINKLIDYNRDYEIDYFGTKTLERSYLLKVHIDKQTYIIERPQHLFMRVALGIHKDDWSAVAETYENLSKRYFTHATPTLFNVGTNHNQSASCFLMNIDDNMDNILDQIKQMGQISKWAGGIGVHMSKIRAKGSLIRGTNGKSEGIIPLCNVINKLSRYVNQGGKRGGAISVFLEIFHADVFEFCELRKQNSGNEDNRARDLFLALWVCDLFMKRVKEDGVWSLMCPDECPGLTTVYGQEFEALYTKYENEKKYKKQIKARKLWKHIIECQMETGLPYMSYKDNANHKSNHKNLGTLTGSNLCNEIYEYCDEGETAVCNLCSICLPRYIVYDNNKPKFDFDKLKEVTRMIVRNLNKVIDDNFYPSENAKKSNFRHRPIGVGVQGLADVYNLFECGYESEIASELNKRIFETIYYASLDESKELAKKDGCYSTFVGSPFSEGLLQYHLCGMKNKDLLTQENDWDMLVNDIKKYGTRNSLITANMPTAGTSQVMGCSECFEPHMSNIFIRTTMAGEFVIVNENLVKMLAKHNLWNDDMRKMLILNNGSIQKINSIPQYIKNIFKTAFEIQLKSIISQAADRSPFIDQSQSMNLFMATPNFKILTSAHFYGWERGLKTGMYYLRTMPAANPVSFGVDIDDVKRLEKKNKEYTEDNSPSCRREKGCVVCGS